jgi:broad specificity phosphatase PhoE
MAKDSQPSKVTKRTYTLYLIRHGEAHHNVHEKRAQKKALKAVIADGIAPDSVEAKRRIELARQQVLLDQSFFDASLSEKGNREAVAVRHVIHQWTTPAKNDKKNKHEPAPAPFPPLPPPTRVLVSPLQRTLQTAELVFPHHPNVHVREELRERLTGRPADNRMASHVSAQRFNRFSFLKLRQNSIVNTMKTMLPFLADKDDDSDDNDGDEKDSTPPPVAVASHPTAPLHQHSSFNSDCSVEDEAQLRQRTLKLLELLRQDADNTVAVVTHKGFLRGLERGPFGQPDAAEFSNGQCKVYRVTTVLDNHTNHTTVEDIERLR